MNRLSLTFTLGPDTAGAGIFYSAILAGYVFLQRFLSAYPIFTLILCRIVWFFSRFEIRIIYSDRSMLLGVFFYYLFIPFHLEQYQ